jgi:hypothetical protein
MYQLPIEQDVSVRGVLPVRSQNVIEGLFKDIYTRPARDVVEAKCLTGLRIGIYKYIRLENNILYNALTNIRRATQTSGKRTIPY